MTDIEAYQRDHLLRERQRLRHPAPPDEAYDRHAFEAADGQSSHDLGRRLVEALLVINENIEACTPTLENCTNPAELGEVDAFWRERLPQWLSDQFVVRPTERRVPNPPPPDFSRMSDREVAAYLKTSAREDDRRDPVLSTWLTMFTLDERYWFYAGHEVRDDGLVVGVEQSEPAGVYALEDLVRHCGGRPAEDVLELKAPKWLSGLFGRS